MDRQVKWTLNLQRDREDSLGSNMDLNRYVLWQMLFSLFVGVFVLIH